MAITDPIESARLQSLRQIDELYADLWRAVFLRELAQQYRNDDPARAANAMRHSFAARQRIAQACGI